MKFALKNNLSTENIWRIWHRQFRQLKSSWQIWRRQNLTTSISSILSTDSAGWAAITIYVDLTSSTRFNTKTNPNSTFCEYLSTWSRETSPLRLVVRALFLILFCFEEDIWKFEIWIFLLNLSLSLLFSAEDRLSDLRRARAREEEGARKQHGTRTKTRRSRATFPWSWWFKRLEATKTSRVSLFHQRRNAVFIQLRHDLNPLT